MENIEKPFWVQVENYTGWNDVAWRATQAEAEAVAQGEFQSYGGAVAVRVIEVKKIL